MFTTLRPCLPVAILQLHLDARDARLVGRRPYHGAPKLALKLLVAAHVVPVVMCCKHSVLQTQLTWELVSWMHRFSGMC